MKFLAGLLIGATLTLMVASLIDYRWEPPSRMARDTGTLASDIPQVQNNDRLPEPEPAPIRSVTIAPLPAEPAPLPAPAIAAVPEMAMERDTEQVLEPVIAPAAVETAVIWKPFHSEVSATGFARRLSTQLGYPFRAQREGPARYHVVFDYDTEQQRELLHSQVTALTGFDAI